jgi:hypothetical protein
VKVVNKPPKFGKTIFVSNHPAAFMDPLVIAAFNRAVVYFMTRSDVFNSFTRPVFWIAHMLPIYRQRDGVNTKEKNLAVFKKCSETLLRNRNLLLFGEGVTDDIFVRRLKQIKKGAVRIGFTALESCDWKEDIYITALGCNYSEPSIYGSDLLMINSNPIHLNAYRAEYKENPSKTISVLTAELQLMLEGTMTHVVDINDTELHENIMRIQRKGMSHFNSNESDLESRHKYSVELASIIENNREKSADLKDQLSSYFANLYRQGISDDLLFDYKSKSFSGINALGHILLAPIVLLGLIHCGLFYWPIKFFVERKFSRPAFWGSTKLIMMIFIAGISNLVVFIFLPDLIGWTFSILYFCLIPFFGHVFHRSFAFWKRMYQLHRLSKRSTESIWNERMKLNQKITTFVE